MQAARPSPLPDYHSPITPVSFRNPGFREKIKASERETLMPNKLLLATLLLGALAFAREPKPYQSGVLVQMDSVECGYDEKDGQGIAGEMLGTDSTHKKTHALLCQEYTLRSDRMVFHIRPKDDKHPVILPIGGIAFFRVEKDKMILRSEDLDDKERQYTVVSIAIREDHKEGDATTSKLDNH